MIYFLLLLAIAIFLFAIGGLFVRPRLKIIAGYAAKSMCSGYFVAGREPDSISLKDLNFSFIKYARAWVDENEKAAYATVLGMAKRKAIYQEGCGCQLLFKDSPVVASPSFSFSQTDVSPDPYWPVGDTPRDTSFEGVELDRLQQNVDAWFDKPGSSLHNSNGVVVVYKDQIVAEQYGPGFTRDTPQLGWSMTKSVTSALVGLLVESGRLKLDQPAPIPEWSQDERKDITLRNLLQMCSGLSWNEDYGSNSDATHMLYMEPDKAAYALDKRLEHEPGTHWVYSSGTTNILQHIIRDAFDNDEAYWRFPYDSLFHPLGMRSFRLETDATGLYIGSSYGYATARDWARFGLLYLHRGHWNGRQILPESWIDFTRTPVEASQGAYGAQFWCNQGGEYPSAPRDMYYCGGFHGQKVFIIPSREMVIVRLGTSEEDTFDFDRFLNDILTCFNTTG